MLKAQDFVGWRFLDSGPISLTVRGLIFQHIQGVTIMSINELRIIRNRNISIHICGKCERNKNSNFHQTIILQCSKWSTK